MSAADALNMSYFANDSRLQQQHTVGATDHPGEQATIQVVAVRSMQIVVGAAILALNAAVVWAVWRERRGCLAEPRHLLLAHLATADALLGASLALFGAHQLSHRPRLQADITACDWVYAMGTVSGASSVYHLLAVTVNQYIAITRPLQYAQYVTHCRAAMASAGIWTASAVVGCLMLLDDHEPPQGRMYCQTQEHTYKGYVVFLAIILFFIPATLLLLAYAYIYAQIKKQRIKESQRLHFILTTANSTSTTNLESFNTSKANLRKEVKNTVKIAFIVFIFIISWVGYWCEDIAFAYEGIERPARITPTIGILNSLYNPIIYALKFDDFKMAFRKMFCGSAWA